ncbi:MAG: hypothetical protein PHH59_14800 [Methylovulum sp.]|uniref:efflux RND transporter periplasmic adaptor subunit n=1 Tax=Methylovulum sp. TaxID=1916980 RepID=UPI00262A57E3|nr:hypothetical protein [Methylovulum sp.]MDD2725272.1 hypothetical protein [Methylovulum sp.]MDD5125861.1 hypothetical protein [Methylovulum sp.]
MSLRFIHCLLLSLLCVNSVVADDDDQAEPSSKIKTINGLTVIKLDGKTQQQTGLAVTVLEPAQHHAEFIAYGKAISIQPLLNLHHRYLAMLTERNRAAAKFKQAEQAIQRQQDLYRNGVTAKRNLQDQQAQWQTDKALLDATQYQDQAIIDEALLNWGKTLSDWALTARAEKLTAFLTGEQTLLQITVPSHHKPAENLHTIAVDVSGERSKAQKAELISVAPQTDANNQGISYFFQTSGKTIKTGMSVSAWLPEQGQQQAGVIIPASAICWATDQAYIYLKTGDGTFTRRAISHYTATANGYFLSDILKPGDAIVTTGAQMLLSEELRGQIPSEDND